MFGIEDEAELDFEQDIPALYVETDSDDSDSIRESFSLDCW